MPRKGNWAARASVSSPNGNMSLGKTIHKALHDNYRQKITSHQDLSVSDISDIFCEDWKTQARETAFAKGEKPGKLKDQGVELLKAYFEEVAPTIQPIDVEREFLVDTAKTGLPILGYIDLVDDRGCIIDHKTTKRSYPEDTAEKDIQLTAYSMAYRAMYGTPDSGVRLDVMVRNKQPKIQQLYGTRTEADIGRFLRLAEQLEKGINAGTFYPNSSYMCGNCGYQGMCEKW